MRKLIVIIVALAAMAALIAVPAGAAPGVGGGLTVVSPNLDNGFPCQGGGAGGLVSFQKFLANQAGLTPTPCTGTIYPGSTATFFGSGTTPTGGTYSFGGSGTIAGSYFYSEPCQTTQVGDTPVSGESYGAPGAPDLNGGLTLTLPTAVGVVDQTPVTSAVVRVAFWWSRVGVTAVVGIRNIRSTIQPGNITINDANATGLAAAVFVPVNQPACTGGPFPTHPGDVEIVSPSLTTGSAA